jgi:hypothetical protein
VEVGGNIWLWRQQQRQGRDVPVRENILGVDNVVLSSFKVVVYSVKFQEYFLNVR